MPRIVVDAEDLAYLGQVLDRTKHELDLLGVRISTYEAALGADRVLRGVDRVISNWSDVREKVTSELEELSEQVVRAAAAYRKLEQEIAAAAGAGEPPPPAPGSAGGG